MGPLRHNPVNPRYFCTPEGKAIYLTGSHSWNNLVDMTFNGEPKTFDFPAYLDLLESWGHNFIRLWAWDSIATWDPNERCLGFPWKRTGPSLAVDGLPAFDLHQLDETHLARMRERVQLARDRGIYVGVMLFESWCTGGPKCTANPLWHVCAAGNNVNGIDINDRIIEGWQVGWMGLRNPKVTAVQDAYLEWVVRGLNDFDNLLYEVSNEAGNLSYGWQTRVVSKIHQIERELPKQHLVGVTGGMGTDNPGLFQTLGDYIAPEGWTVEGEKSPYRDGFAVWGRVHGELSKVPVILDTDHIWGIGGHAAWAWWSFTCGYNVLYMDRMDDQPWFVFEHPWWNETANVALRREMGAIRQLSDTFDLNHWIPQPELASTGYCLTGEGAFVAVGKKDEDFTLHVPSGTYHQRIRDYLGGTWSPTETVEVGNGALHIPQLGERVVVLTPV